MGDYKNYVARTLLDAVLKSHSGRLSFDTLSWHQFCLDTRTEEPARYQNFVPGLRVNELRVDEIRDLFHHKEVYSFNSNHMWLTCRNHFGNVLYSVLTQENALYT